MTKTEPKNVRLTVAVSEKEADYIRNTADASNVTVSELIREVLVGFAD